MAPGRGYGLIYARELADETIFVEAEKISWPENLYIRNGRVVKMAEVIAVARNEEFHTGKDSGSKYGLIFWGKGNGLWDITDIRIAHELHTR